MQFTRKKKIASAIAVGAMALASGGVAIAYWTSSGGGSGTATTGAAPNGIVVAGSNVSAGLAPGVQPEAVTATITNNASENQYVTSLSVSIDSVTPSPITNTCATSNYDISTTQAGAGLSDSPAAGNQSIGPIPVGEDLAASGGQTTVTFYIGFVDDPTVNQDGCQHATVNLTYTTA